MLKKGELTSERIVTIVLLIVAFLIVVILAARLFDSKADTDREICRLSVLTRATSPLESLQASVPLKCTMEKICISESGKKDACKQFIGEENIRGVKLKGSDGEKARIIEREAAEAMYFCWSMMGQGKLNVFKGDDRDIPGTIVFEDIFDIAGKSKSTCVICSRLALSDDIPENVRDLVDVNRYLENETVPNSGETYLKTFTDEQVKAYPQNFLVNMSKSGSGEELPEPIKTSQIAFVFMQIKAPEDEIEKAFESAARTSFLIAGSSALSPTSVFRHPFTFIAGVAGGGILAGTISGINSHTSRQAAGGYCGMLTGEGKESSGCSLVFPIDYKASTINELCYTIDGNP